MIVPGVRCTGPASPCRGERCFAFPESCEEDAQTSLEIQLRFKIVQSFRQREALLESEADFGGGTGRELDRDGQYLPEVQLPPRPALTLGQGSQCLTNPSLALADQ